MQTQAPARAGQPFEAIEDRAIRDLHEVGATPETIARFLERTPAGVRARLERLGLVTPEQLDQPAKTKPMRIGQIREVIRFAAYVRHDRTGGTSEEFRRQQVGPELRLEIAKLQALMIPPRFAADIERRDDEIRYCEKVIARWEAAQSEPVQDRRTCREGGVRHVFLGAPTCQLCGVHHING